MIGRWKMLDNLRRTLLAPSAWLALVMGWTLPLPGALLWSGFVLATLAIPTLMPFLSGFVPRRFGISKRSHLSAVGADLGLALSQIGFAVTLLAHQAWLMSDAIVRTLFRLLVTRRRMLEWVTAAQATLGPRLDLRGLYRRMAGGVALAAAAAALVACAGRASWAVALPFLVLWMLSPAIARWASLPPPVAGRKPVSDEDARRAAIDRAPHVAILRDVRHRRRITCFLRTTSRKTRSRWWRIGPPRRTSGSTSCRWSPRAISDGWGCSTPSTRLDATLASMNALERFRGHFYNWYATQDLRPLEPKYVSSVDSGNLAGHLIALESACREMTGRPVVSPEWLAGIRDTLALTREALLALADDRRTQTVTWKQLDEALEALAASLSPTPATPAEIARRLAEIVLHADTVIDIARTLTAERGDGDAAEVLSWAEALGASIRAHERDVELLMPFAPLLADEVALGPCFDSIPTLWPICRIAARRLSPSWRERRERAAPSDAGQLVRSSRCLVDALERSAAAARSLERRLAALAEQARQPVPGDGVRLPVRPRRDSCSRSATGWPTASSIPAATTCSLPKRGSRASSRSRRETSRCGIGSASGAR